jgi:predicted ATP-binding protein involved in virulence
LICIDEGDLYLHPKWQIEFFDKLLKVLPSIYSGNIQLILTSHSPFLLSDLPKQNITILDRDQENSTLDGYKLKMNTFGGNLYDLYSEPFFLGNKRTSDFAYSKIKDLIKKVENKDYTIKEKEELIKLNDILGDEIIQYRIKKILGND